MPIELLAPFLKAGRDTTNAGTLVNGQTEAALHGAKEPTQGQHVSEDIRVTPAMAGGNSREPAPPSKRLNFRNGGPVEDLVDGFSHERREQVDGEGRST